MQWVHDLQKFSTQYAVLFKFCFIVIKATIAWFQIEIKVRKKKKEKYSVQNAVSA